MTPDVRLAEIVAALVQAGLDCLVMGGHAVRYFGVDRNTADFDLCVSAPSLDEVRKRLATADLFRDLAPREGPSWRPDDFARFEVGRLPDGREEWLEFWLRNHLLPSFAELKSRHERGSYGGRQLGFLSLPDLIRSKETERETDWADVALLEEILDARHLARLPPGEHAHLALCQLRSRRGFDRAMQMGLFHDEAVVGRAIGECVHPVTFAFLVPFVSHTAQPAGLRVTIDEAYLGPLRKSSPGSSRHLGLVEVVRRAYKRWAAEVDRQDKESRRLVP